MAQLIGFRQAKARQTTENQIADLVVKSYLNRTQYGEFNTVEEVQGAIDQLSKLPQTVQVQEKIADLENKKLQISAKLSDLLNDKDLFDSDLNERLASAARNNINQPLGLVGTYAAMYGDAAERYEEEIYNTIATRYGTADKIPQEVLNYRKELADKANLYGNIFNSYQLVDAQSNERGTLDANAFAVKIDTNPATGNIVRVEIVPSGDEASLKGYMRTDTPMQMVEGMPSKKLPVYLRTFDAGTTETGRKLRGARLGAFTYAGVDTKTKNEDVGTAGVAELKVQKTEHGFVNWVKDIFSQTQSDVVNEVRENGILLKNFKLDSTDVPDAQVLRMGNRLFYSTDQKDQILEIQGKDAAEKRANLEKYLKAQGKPTDMIDVPFFITRQALQAPDGSSRVKGTIDANTLQVPTAPAAPTSSLNRPSTTAVAPSEILQPAAGFFSQQPAFQNALSTPATISRETGKPANKPEAAVESRGGGFSLGDVIEKGKSFFRSRFLG